MLPLRSLVRLIQRMVAAHGERTTIPRGSTLVAGGRSGYDETELSPTMAYDLRYYAPHFARSTHAEILRLLGEIGRRHSLHCEIREVPHRPGVDPSTWIADEAAERELYEQDFRPRAAVLKHRTGESVRKLLRSNSGGYFVAGTVAITKNGQIEWLASHATPFPQYNQDPTLGFLKALLEHGPQLLEQLTPPVLKGAPELRIIDAFISAGSLVGEYHREVKVGRHRVQRPEEEIDRRKSIDLVCKNAQETWILEAKTKLNYEALGEVLTYGGLYAAEHPDELVKLGIVCAALDEDILEACKARRVTVFQVMGDTVAIQA